MTYVYLIQRLVVPDQRYLGISANLDERLRTHHAGGSPHTSKYRPWKFVVHLCFQNDQRAVESERYLKSGLGQASTRSWSITVGGWWYRRYAPRGTVREGLENESRKAKNGLWVDPKPAPQWVLRNVRVPAPVRRYVDFLCSSPLRLLCVPPVRLRSCS
jgi:predicted GIY-YIG superfamily endonuclease